MRIFALAVLAVIPVLCIRCDASNKQSAEEGDGSTVGAGDAPLELRFYGPGDEEERILALMEFVVTADWMLNYDRAREFKPMGSWYGKLRESGHFGRGTGGGSARIKLGFEEIEAFLSTERQKNLVVVWFEKRVMHSGKDFVAQSAREVTDLLTRVGYARVIIFGAHSLGVYYVADTQLEMVK